jgi:crossover junction endodeoxyribonuclease RuvC
MLVIGIDPGTAITGYGLVRETEDGTLEAVEHGVIRTPADQPMPERLVLLYDKLKEISHLHQPDSSAVEMLFFQRNVKSCFSSGMSKPPSRLGRGAV